MYAIVEISGKQFKVAESDTLKIPAQNAEADEVLEFPNVMLLDDNGEVKLGSPFVKDAVVKARVVEHGRDRKVIVFKKKRRKDYKVKRGHRQDFTMVKIDSIGTSSKAAGTKSSKAAPAKSPAATPKKNEAPKKPVKKSTAASKSTASKSSAATKSGTSKKAGTSATAGAKKATASKKTEKE